MIFSIFSWGFHLISGAGPRLCPPCTLVRQARFAKCGGHPVALVGGADRKSFVDMRSAKTRLQFDELRHRFAALQVVTSGANQIHDQSSERMRVGGELD